MKRKGISWMNLCGAVLDLMLIFKTKKINNLERKINLYVLHIDFIGYYLLYCICFTLEQCMFCSESINCEIFKIGN